MEGFEWFCPPPAFAFPTASSVRITTGDGFRSDSGHFLFRRIRGDFVLTAVAHFSGGALYDQCGLLARVDGDNWIKCACEYETAAFAHLGSVVTNLGYSDWAKQEIPASVHAIKYRLERRGQDFFVSAATDCENLKEIRVAHLHRAGDEILAGVYACSPQRAGFECEITDIEITK
jgi:regulation of enolase protein 1 (concanavalin A-like superfamily)